MLITSTSNYSSILEMHHVTQRAPESFKGTKCSWPEEAPGFESALEEELQQLPGLAHPSFSLIPCAAAELPSLLLPRALRFNIQHRGGLDLQVQRNTRESTEMFGLGFINTPSQVFKACNPISHLKADT